MLRCPSHLDAEARRLVDKQLAGAGLDHMGYRQAEALVKKLAYEADRAGCTNRARKAREDRCRSNRVSPVSLRRHADVLIATGATGGRSRDQVMADTLVERLTGQTRATDVPVKAGIVIPVDALADPDSPATAEVVGRGPLPAGIVTDLLPRRVPRPTDRPA